jgi:hypothetical protein
MKRQGLGKLYEKLTPEERFRLDEAAEENVDPAMAGDLEKISHRVEESSGRISQLLDRLERELAGKYLAVWEAYTRFCEDEMGMGAEKVLKATFEPALQNVRFLEELADRLGLEPEPTTVEEYRVALAEGWRRVVDRVWRRST